MAYSTLVCTDTNGETARYTIVAMILHWLIAIFIITNPSIGYFMPPSRRHGASWRSYFMYRRE